MSSSDIRDILQINNSSKEFIQKKPKQTVEKRPGFFFFFFKMWFHNDKTDSVSRWHQPRIISTYWRRTTRCFCKADI